MSLSDLKLGNRFYQRGWKKEHKRSNLGFWGRQGTIHGGWGGSMDHPYKPGQVTKCCQTVLIVSVLPPHTTQNGKWILLLENKFSNIFGQLTQENKTSQHVFCIIFLFSIFKYSHVSQSKSYEDGQKSTRIKYKKNTNQVFKY